MIRTNPLRPFRPAAAVLGAVALFAACAGDETAPLGGPSGGALAVGVLVSDANARPGDEIAVAVATEGEELAGVQGYLRYDPRALEYVGQGTEGALVTVVNPSRAALGELRTISYLPGTVLPAHAGRLVFRVKGGDYAASLRYELEMATDRSTNREITRARQAPTIAAADLAVPAEARQYDYASLTATLYPELTAAERRLPKANVAGQYLANLRYGNANLSAESPSSCTSVNILDAAYIANIAVGNNSVLAVDFPTRDPVVAGNVRPATGGAHPGVNASGARSIDILDAAAVANEAVGNDQTIVCDPIPGRAPVTGNVVQVTGNITADRTFYSDTVYQLNGVVKVNNGATLTIQPGTRIEGKYLGAGTFQISELLIERDGRINAVGTQLQPIVFTCDQTPKFKGCWGGLAIMGNASVNAAQSATLTSPVIPGRAATGGCFSTRFEGTTGTPSQTDFGGCNDADSSGVLKYAIVEYGGYAFAANTELNNLTVGGLGSKTVIEYVQVHAGLDDGFEIWGGTFNTRYIVMTANSDDDFDFASGWTGKAQFLISQKDSLDGDKTMEIDNTEVSATYNSTPRVTAQIYNYTLVGKADPAGTGGALATNNVEDAIHLRRGARPSFFNMIITGYPIIMDLDDAATCPTGADLSTEVKLQSVTYFNNSRLDNTDADPICQPYTTLGTETNLEALVIQDAQFGNIAAASQPLTAPFNVLTPDFRPVSAAAVSQGSSTTPPNDGFFDATANYRGAVAPGASGSIPWYAGWTRTWTTATTP